VSDSDLMFRPAIELAGMVRAGEISARELVQISLERIEELNPALNAFVQVDAERALASAAEIGPGDARPFAGVPTAIKNNRAAQGLRLTYCRALMERNQCDYDHNVTRRLKDAGFVIVGTTTLPEYGILPVSEARILGRRATRGTSNALPAAPRAARRRSRAACCRSPTATTVAARSASRLRAAASWG
jgi:amidase